MTQRKPPARPQRPSPDAAASQVKSSSGPVNFQAIQKRDAQRITLYGPGGIGKTTLAATAPGPVVFFDLDDSLPILLPQLDGLDLRVVPVDDWQSMRDALHGSGWDDIKTIVIDSGSQAELMAANWTFANTPHPDKPGTRINNIEDYGFGKGYEFVYTTFLKLLGDLDQHVRNGRNVIIVCHDCTTPVPNPAGVDWIRYEPRLQSPKSGKASIRLRLREWCDHMFFIGYDVNVGKDGKANGSGTRTIYPVELPHCMAKCRSFADAIPLEYQDRTLWNLLFENQEGNS